ncbi:YdcH family protein [Pseudemcibacter aquimaris]|uniref:YdcH family protein n=1 Tax=Pseudemcibacter aquimaris TaxID=2857064 RepID=UPI002010EA0E|nr:YdcH family protein [Pseudemcibacter aquimaris]MCC3861422.1 YdcH family protein [Pseudemcibacter aquimaris]WDU58192.1 YdcH family protein [Pseudemcibacter aquimaris]
MHSEAHINALSKKHAALDERIHHEEMRPAPDSTILHELKKEKLVLKDEIARLSTQ